MESHEGENTIVSERSCVFAVSRVTPLNVEDGPMHNKRNAGNVGKEGLQKATEQATETVMPWSLMQRAFLGPVWFGWHCLPISCRRKHTYRHVDIGFPADSRTANLLGSHHIAVHVNVKDWLLCFVVHIVQVLGETLNGLC